MFSHSLTSFYRAVSARQLRRSMLFGSVAAISLLSGPVFAEDNQESLRIMTFNTWGDQFRNNLDAIAPLFVEGGYDIINFQELGSEAYLTGLQQRLRDAGLGEYTYIKQGDNGVLSRVEGTMGRTYSGDDIAYQSTTGAGGTPETIFGSLHLDYRDPSTTRLREMEGILDWSSSTNRSVILSGDYNAGDVSERGMHRASQQKLILQNYLRSNNSFYATLLDEYAVDKDAMNSFIADHRGQSLSLNDIPDSLFADEMHPVEHNTPVTMNMMKRDFIMLQTETSREKFAPHELGDGSTTWTSVEEDHTNVWPSWDRVKIDHMMASRPFGKWWQVVDAADDPYTGVLDQTDVTESGKAFSDHELVAHDLAWVGPKLEYFDDTEGNEQTRLVWGEGANTFEADGGVYHLTRNNMRTDVYLGQVSDEYGNPTLMGLTTEEKQTLLDCGSSDARFQTAINDYCIDDHSFITETLVTDGGTVIVDEDAALGGSTAKLRLSDGTLRIDGTEMDTLNREVSLEDTGGTVSVKEVDHTVTAAREISGDGALKKTGAGTLVLDADNSYRGGTEVLEGKLDLAGSVQSDVFVADSAILSGGGTVYGNLSMDTDAIFEGGLSDDPLAMFETLTVAGDLHLNDTLFETDHFADLSFEDGLFYSLINLEGDLFGQFAGLGEGDLISTISANLYFSYAGGDGNDIGFFAAAPSAVPLPAPALLLLGGLTGLGLTRRLRRRS
ncbi:endonuclease/exonuclease/phosphatase family protein [Qingshengfaniella alkalisoli]|uniref:Endonuclease/exonuclease/phosphatase domain-containing protein n=1 Tax=Qingshengfaniella alkalisoli TaxID=2599296 RepID=A0A5B8J091_9RHOB|nr:endonuclease/exonuclease/phosphatase family protein [Qingshengfaniella alkalisoli]QDY70601.1 hypothetical protein FPZ52_12970 [Qingshengfaniella alkalisoli]